MIATTPDGSARRCARTGFLGADALRRPGGPADGDLRFAIRAFQHDFNLTPDERITPNGETARMLGRVARPAAAREDATSGSTVRPDILRGGQGDKRLVGARTIDERAARDALSSGRQPTQVAEAIEDFKSTELMGSAPRRSTAPPIDIPPPDVKRVRVDEMYAALNFDPDGLGEKTRGILMGPRAVTALIEFSAARNAAERHRVNGTFPIANPNNQATAARAEDAFRHTLWSYRMAKQIGYHLGKEAGDSREITIENAIGGRLMDLYNNEVGRRLAANPQNHAQSDEDVILDAMRNGMLRLEPFVITGAP